MITSTNRVGPVGASLYRAIWRWHFFAGLLVIPALLNLAITGSLYLFKDEINNSVFSYRYTVRASGDALNPETIVEKAVAAIPGSTATTYKNPASVTQSAIVTVLHDNVSTLVFVNPYTGKILDKVSVESEFNYIVKRIHSWAFFGSWANKLIEIAGGFTMVLVVTGIYLWWPRRQSGGVISVRGNSSQRVFWRDLHAITGVSAGAFIFFLALSGMPWSGFWGSNLSNWANERGLGYPAQLWDDVPKSSKVSKDILPKVGWAVEQAPVPLSDAAVLEAKPPVGLDTIVEQAKAGGISPGFDVALPRNPSGVYSAAIYPDQVAGQRMIHFDQYSGKPLVDLSYAQYPILGKSIEWGISVHQGQEYGRVNQLLMLTACLLIIGMSVTSVVMWWKRRPAGTLGVPPKPRSHPIHVGLWLVIILFSLAFPLSGLAILVMIFIDQILVRLVKIAIA
ncbi:PepSY domain-containing protein [Rhizobium sp. SSA_523]|uniref:PepSY-associated TM helix domain-containing protein n=1 Tax=Rhizobium sp. SSA_523 TaxID=2952477 RepID=UPI002090FF56|nr:PepSY domain-containing protein [Rhizobium sp. SSA_523]MCO5734322.1 PepSY domain-containing protein [Rhizobium sp. SSA_523]WKC21019.1 PepSY domain-containing protein [Rhizobium sp. SSA_523]